MNFEKTNLQFQKLNSISYDIQSKTIQSLKQQYQLIDYQKNLSDYQKLIANILEKEIVIKMNYLKEKQDKLEEQASLSISKQQLMLQLQEKFSKIQIDVYDVFFLIIIN